MKQIKQILNKFFLYRYLAFKLHKYTVQKNPKVEADRVYLPFFKKPINWKNPKNLIEKIYWLQFNSDTTLWSTYADKLAVRSYIISCGYPEILPQLYGSWEDASQIQFDDLPKSFVLKTTNGCGTVLVIKDKTKIKQNLVKKRMNRWLAIPYGYRGAQLHYTRIEPRIIAEEFLVQDSNDQIISPNSLIDYKIYCINGEPEAIWVSFDRTPTKGVNMTMYNLQWRKTPENLVSSDYYTYSEVNIPKPQCLDEMLDISRKLSKPFNQVRVDFYVINNKPVFGEMTFTTGWGFFTHEYYNHLGSKINLSQNS